ncbi:hypothetical protein M6D93_01345 [Jatrophihabitans telluris]|uniref:Uncharacterized protein n=1 Tax=Jatrophihabitans telluris TaxID=2038343 RepID=A0ABY4R0S5_9ACTN|nr:hypothetical protein [Jatrophihabitans telluris]UQX88659.1 hypothetical protein M6D93_01345 [Jatrophihabitans telluris]
MDRSELRGWIEDALARHERDCLERGEDVTGSTVAEIIDAVWGRLPLEVRRATTRTDVQASLTMLTVRRGLGVRTGASHRAALEGDDPHHRGL